MNGLDQPSPGLLLMRADAGPTIGTGHVLRCLALAQAWRDAGGEVMLAAAELPAPLAARWRAESANVVRIHARRGTSSDAAATRRIAAVDGAAWIVADGYEFSTDYLAHLHETGTPLAVLDDMVHLQRYPVDLVLNQNLSATESAYRGKTAETTRLLLGPKFSLLRREFRVPAAEPCRRERPARRILVTFGGADAENFTGRILENLGRSAQAALDVVVLAGSANPHVDLLRAQAASLPFPCDVRVGVENVAAVMRWADAAISAGGSTVWELAAMRLPALIGVTGPDQHAGMSALAAVSFFRAQPIESWLAGDLAQEVANLPAAGTAVAGCDALGAVRVVGALLTPAAVPAMTGLRV